MPKKKGSGTPFQLAAFLERTPKQHSGTFYHNNTPDAK
jgi:hypothetical protein